VDLRRDGDAWVDVTASRGLAGLLGVTQARALDLDNDSRRDLVRAGGGGIHFHPGIEGAWDPPLRITGSTVSPHQGGPLCDGKLSGLFQADRPGEYQYSRPGEILRCPWHGWEFDIRNGQSWFDPAKTRVRKYEVSVEPGAELEPDELAAASGYQKGPYTAETFAVTVEEQYVVLEV
jgi:3-phenylpropionate/trans-cinnamate dioxygenase ferredoxin subunit